MDVKIFVLLLVVVVTAVAAKNMGLEDLAHHAKNCGDLGFCCQEKNNSCRATGPSMRVDQKHHKHCYCDSHCLITNDCCVDYQDVCRPVDCVLNDWTDWGACSKGCGWGETIRTRSHNVAPLNAGKPCESRKQKAFCTGTDNCRGARHSSGVEALRETGKILPAQYGPWRKSKMYNPYADIRKNLFNHYSAHAAVDRPAYYAQFEITEARKSCRLFQDWARPLAKGATVCVECQQLAMKHKLGVRCKGDGVVNRETRWHAVTVPGCHGKWLMKQDHEEGACNKENTLSFILV